MDIALIIFVLAIGMGIAFFLVFLVNATRGDNTRNPSDEYDANPW